LGPRPGERSDQQARPGVGQGPHAREEAGVGAPAGGAKRPASTVTNVTPSGLCNFSKQG